MHFEQLDYIIEVAQRGNITRAAEALHVSHSAISQAITQLEAEIGVTVFHRSRSGSILTEEGREVIKLAYEILGKKKELLELGQRSTMLKGDLKISASSIFFTSLLPGILYSFKLKYPYIQITINEDEVENIIASVRDNKVDIGLIAGPDNLMQEIHHMLSYRLLLKSRFMVCAGKNMDIAYSRKVTPEELAKYPLVIRNDKNTRNLIQLIASKAGSGKMNVLFYSNNNDVIRNVIANNLALGIYTDFWLEQDPLVKSGEIIPVPLEADGVPASNLMYLQAKNKPTYRVEKEFLDYLTEQFDHYKSGFASLP